MKKRLRWRYDQLGSTSTTYGYFWVVCDHKGNRNSVNTGNNPTSLRNVLVILKTYMCIYMSVRFFLRFLEPYVHIWANLFSIALRMKTKLFSTINKSSQDLVPAFDFSLGKMLILDNPLFTFTWQTPSLALRLSLQTTPLSPTPDQEDTSLCSKDSLCL